jgi:hypothetical protein
MVKLYVIQMKHTVNPNYCDVTFPCLFFFLFSFFFPSATPNETVQNSYFMFCHTWCKRCWIFAVLQHTQPQQYKYMLYWNTKSKALQNSHNNAIFASNIPINQKRYRIFTFHTPVNESNIKFLWFKPPNVETIQNTKQNTKTLHNSNLSAIHFSVYCML